MLCTNQDWNYVQSGELEVGVSQKIRIYIGKNIKQIKYRSSVEVRKKSSAVFVNFGQPFLCKSKSI